MNSFVSSTKFSGRRLRYPSSLENQMKRSVTGDFRNWLEIVSRIFFEVSDCSYSTWFTIPSNQNHYSHTNFVQDDGVLVNRKCFLLKLFENFVSSWLTLARQNGRERASLISTVLFNPWKYEICFHMENDKKTNEPNSFQ